MISFDDLVNVDIDLDIIEGEIKQLKVDTAKNREMIYSLTLNTQSIYNIVSTLSGGGPYLEDYSLHSSLKYMYNLNDTIASETLPDDIYFASPNFNLNAVSIDTLHFLNATGNEFKSNVNNYSQLNKFNLKYLMFNNNSLSSVKMNLTANQINNNSFLFNNGNFDVDEFNNNTMSKNLSMCINGYQAYNNHISCNGMCKFNFITMATNTFEVGGYIKLYANSATSNSIRTNGNGNFIDFSYGTVSDCQFATLNHLHLKGINLLGNSDNSTNKRFVSASFVDVENYNIHNYVFSGIKFINIKANTLQGNTIGINNFGNHFIDQAISNTFRDRRANMVFSGGHDNLFSENYSLKLMYLDNIKDNTYLSVKELHINYTSNYLRNISFRSISKLFLNNTLYFEPTKDCTFKNVLSYYFKDYSDLFDSNNSYTLTQVPQNQAFLNHIPVSLLNNTTTSGGGGFDYWQGFDDRPNQGYNIKGTVSNGVMNNAIDYNGPFADFSSCTFGFPGINSLQGLKFEYNVFNLNAQVLRFNYKQFDLNSFNNCKSIIITAADMYSNVFKTCTKVKIDAIDLHGINSFSSINYLDINAMVNSNNSVMISNCSFVKYNGDQLNSAYLISNNYVQVNVSSMNNMIYKNTDNFITCEEMKTNSFLGCTNLNIQAQLVSSNAINNYINKCNVNCNSAAWLFVNFSPSTTYSVIANEFNIDCQSVNIMNIYNVKKAFIKCDELHYAQFKNIDELTISAKTIDIIGVSGCKNLHLYYDSFNGELNTELRPDYMLKSISTLNLYSEHWNSNWSNSQPYIACYTDSVSSINFNFMINNLLYGTTLNAIYGFFSYRSSNLLVNSIPWSYMSKLV